MVGLVLEGGGVRGAYQIGAYRAFKKCGIKIDGIVGTSIGSFNGAMIVGKKEKELYEFWKNADVGAIFNFNDKYLNSINNKEKFKALIYGIEQMAYIVKNKGISTDNMKEILKKMIDEETIRKSKMDYGLVTVRVNDLKPLYLYKEDIEEGKIPEYILASCNLPVFKMEKFSDNNLYLDGCFYDNSPVNMLVKKGYKKIYVLDIQGLGFKRKPKRDIEIIKIKPSKFLGGSLNINREKINENIELGYYDTIKVLKNYDGYNFIFKKCPNWVYNILARHIDKDLYKKCKRYFMAKNNKELIIKSLEYAMLKEKKTYFNIYSTLKIIKEIKNKKSKSFVYELISDLRFI